MAIKCPDKENFEKVNSHMMFVSKRCNFRCCFCKYKNGYIDDSINGEYTRESKSLTLEQMQKKIEKLFDKGSMFKFSGCEPLLNPHLEKYLEFVKTKGGIVFLDTNCSMTLKIKKLIDKNLVDILGASLKGVDKEIAAKISGVKINSLAWENVLESIDYAIKSDNVNRVIITHVVYNHTEEIELKTELIKFFNIFNHYRMDKKLYDKIYFKFNNLFREIGNDKFSPVDCNLLTKVLKELSEEHKYLKNKIILVNSKECVSDYSKIIFI